MMTPKMPLLVIALFEKLNVLYENDWLDEAEKWMLEYENSLLKMTSTFEYGPDLLSAQQTWTFSGAFHYSLALVTTIGNNNNSPKSTQGKVFTIVYASVGIPLMLVVLSNCSYTLINAIKQLQQQIIAIPDKMKNQGDKVQMNVRYRLIDSTEKSLSVEVKNCGEGPVITKVLTELETESSKQQYELKNGYIPSNYIDDESSNNIVVYDESDQNRDFDTNTENNFPERMFKKRHVIRKKNNTIISYNNAKTRTTASLTVLFVIVVLSGAYLIVGSLVISMWKDCPYLEAISFCCLTIITIGYNDSFRKYLYKLDIFNNNVYYSIFLCSFLFLGMTLLVAVLSVFSEKVRSMCYNSKTSLQHGALL